MNTMKSSLPGPVRALSLSCLLLAAACSNANDGLGDVDGSRDWYLGLAGGESSQLSSFELTVLGVELIGPESEVSLLAQPVSVQLVDPLESCLVVSVAEVPDGEYTSAAVRVDLDSVEAWLLGAASSATVLDGDGEAVAGEAEWSILFPGALELAGGDAQLLALDLGPGLGLDGLVQADLPENTLRIEPAVLAAPGAGGEKPVVMEGRGSGFDAAEGEFDLALESRAGVTFGDVEVRVDSSTVYQVNGLPLLGLGGLLELAGQASGTWVRVEGALDPEEGELVASVVEAGSGTYGGGQDLVEGQVVARLGGAGSDAQLTVVGRSSSANHLTQQFNTTFLVATSFAATRVVEQGGQLPLRTDDVNVGQTVRLYGQLSGTNLDMLQQESVARLLPTSLYGIAAAAPSGGLLEVELVRVGPLPAGDYSWDDSGPTPPDPQSFIASIAGLDSGQGLEAGSQVLMRGFLPAVDDPGVDLEADDLVDNTASATVLVRDRADGQVVAVTRGEDLQLSVSGEAVDGEEALLDRGILGQQDLPTEPSPVISGNGGSGVYLLRERGSGESSLYLDFAELLAAWDVLEGAGANLYDLSASGTWDESTSTLAADRVLLVLQ